MKILIISGFLGAGKTTFIKELAKRTGRDFAILENEYGAIDIDGSLLKQERGERDLRIWEMTEGCICCSVKSDFAGSVLTIANALDPEYLVVEPTGVGMLSRILDNLRQIQYDRISLLQPVTVANARHLQEMLREYPEICRDQLSAAGTVALSKCEGMAEESLRPLLEEIRRIAPKARVTEGHYRDQGEDFWNGILESHLSGETVRETKTGEEEMPEHFALQGVRLPGETELLLFLEGLVSGVFGRVARAKGYFPAGETWLRFDVVEGQYSVTGCPPMEDRRAVFIGKDLRKELLREALLQDFFDLTGPEIWQRKRAPGRRLSAASLQNRNNFVRKMA